MGTGGLGGVHRGFPHPPDVSADLGELVRTEALIVSSGVKSILDVPATAELLETLGVPVLGFRTDDLPLFYAAHGGPPVSARVESAAGGGRGRAGALAARTPHVDPPRPPGRGQPRRRRAADRAGARRGARAGHDGPGRDSLRPLLPPPRVRRSHARGEPRADRRERRAWPRRWPSPMPLYDAVKDLTLVVERVELEPLSLPLRHLTRRTTVVHLHGGGHEGVGEDVSYEEELQLAFTARRAPGARRRAHARGLLGPRRGASPATGRGGSSRPRSTSRSARPASRSPRRSAASREPVRFCVSQSTVDGAARALPGAPLQARRQRQVDGRGRRRARRDRRRRRRRPQGPVRGRVGRRDALRRALRPRRRGASRTPGSRTRA